MGNACCADRDVSGTHFRQLIILYQNAAVKARAAQHEPALQYQAVNPFPNIDVKAPQAVNDKGTVDKNQRNVQPGGLETFGYRKIHIHYDMCSSIAPFQRWSEVYIGHQKVSAPDIVSFLLFIVDSKGWG